MARNTGLNAVLGASGWTVPPIDGSAALAAELATYGLVIEPGTTLFVGPTDPSAQMSVGDVWIDSSAA